MYNKKIFFHMFSTVYSSDKRMSHVSKYKDFPVAGVENYDFYLVKVDNQQNKDHKKKRKKDEGKSGQKCFGIPSTLFVSLCDIKVKNCFPRHHSVVGYLCTPYQYISSWRSGQSLPTFLPTTSTTTNLFSL